MNESNHPCRGRRNEYNVTMLVGRLIGSHREVGRRRKGEREGGTEAGREACREGERQGVRREGVME